MTFKFHFLTESILMTVVDCLNIFQISGDNLTCVNDNLGHILVELQLYCGEMMAQRNNTTSEWLLFKKASRKFPR